MSELSDVKNCPMWHFYLIYENKSILFLGMSSLVAGSISIAPAPFAQWRTPWRLFVSEALKACLPWPSVLTETETFLKTWLKCLKVKHLIYHNIWLTDICDPDFCGQDACAVIAIISIMDLITLICTILSDYLCIYDKFFSGFLA